MAQTKDAVATDEARRAQATSEQTAPAPSGGLIWTILGVAVVIGLAIVVDVITSNMPTWTKGTWFGSIAKSVEFPIYAIALGFLANGVLSLTGLRDKLNGGFRTEFFIKTGLVLLGASVNVGVIVKMGLPAVSYTHLTLPTICSV